MARKSFKKMSIEVLEQATGLSYENASKLQRRLYRQVLRKYGDTRPFIASRELYYSLTSDYGSIKFTNDFMSINKVDVERARDILKNRMKKLIRKTGGMKGEVGSAMNDYLSGKITYKDFKVKVASAKRSARYMAVQEENYS